ncbi:hypothetical protein HF086_001484 [Spodoptera exigua]|uniref:Meiosis-specific nuclear structural protein 1 n=1 Tax=Spodoptera exigua TaxID=7107 RepID=A0A922M4B6_SPOEX|nr:hypothetical protein HF086_001484 [Spodoptera exigua]
MEPRTELQRNALTEARRKELNVYQRALDLKWLDSRMADGRMGRCLALIQREAEMEREFKERTDHAAIVNARAEKDTKLGIEIANIRHEEVCQLLRRHYLRERDPSLRELARKLQAGYVCKDLQLQILNNEYKRLQEKEQKEKMERTSQYCKELQQQLVNRHLQKQCQYEDSLIEKKMLEDIMRTISDEDMNLAAREEKMRKKEEFTEKMSAKILADEAARQERTNIIKLLQEQEYLEKNFQDDIAERDKSRRARHDTYSALTLQMDERRRAARDCKLQEAHYRKMLISLPPYFMKLQQEVAKEREKMIAEHVPGLVGYVTAGVLRQEDLPALRRGAKARPDLAHLDIDRMANSNKPHRFVKCNPQCKIIREY